MHKPHRRLCIARHKKHKRLLHQRFRQCMFERDRMAGLNTHILPRVVVLTGAGISVESGIRAFRAADGLWEEHRVEDVATPEGYQRDPQQVQNFYNARRHDVQQPHVRPNAAHQALAELEAALGENFLLVTQNIDNLHERAGSHRVIHMHGELLKVRCPISGEVQPWTRDVTPDDRCTCCEVPMMLRPHIVWFGEMPLEMDKINQALQEADYFISIGTSGHVYPAAGFVQEAALQGAHTVELNLDPGKTDSFFAEKIYGPASDVVPAYVDTFLASLYEI